jgi:hypothetical protein
MDIRQATDAEKQLFFEKAETFFESIRNMVNTLEKDITSENLMTQAAAVYITRNMAAWYGDFMSEIQKIHLKKEELQKQIREASNTRDKINDC